MSVSDMAVSDVAFKIIGGGEALGGEMVSCRIVVDGGDGGWIWMVRNRYFLYL
jgi:hypothetical protein